MAGLRKPDRVGQAAWAVGTPPCAVSGDASRGNGLTLGDLHARRHAVGRRERLTMDQLQGIVAQVLELPSDEVDDEVGPATRSEWTSLKHLQITVAVEDAYRVRLVPREVRAVRSIGDLRRLLRDKGVSA